MAETQLTDGVFSILDTDFYKLNMQCAILKYFPDVVVEYNFTNRTPHMRLNHEAVRWLRRQISRLENLQLTSEELQYLRRHCSHLDNEYLQFLSLIRLRPEEQVQILTRPTDRSEFIDIDITIHGLWVETLLYEIPILALTSEAYFRFVDTDWSHCDQETAAYEKGIRLLQAGCVFSEFGSRRRRDFYTHNLVMKGLVRSMQDSQDAPGRFLGTSNVYLAMRFDLEPIGTVAHEWYMTIAAINDDYENANELGLKYWLDCYGGDVLGIALTDTFGTPNFFKAFGKGIQPIKGRQRHDSGVDGQGNTIPDARSYAEVFIGIRQDSGDPKEYIQQAATFYGTLGNRNKGVIFSDSLNVGKCIE